MSKLLRGKRQVSPELYEDLISMAIVAIAELNALGKLEADESLIIASVHLDVIDQLRSTAGRRGSHKRNALHVSLDKVVDSTIAPAHDSGSDYYRVVEDPDGHLELDRVLEVDEARRELDRLWPLLSDRERFIAEMRAGGFTLLEIATALGVTESRASQLLTQLEKRARRVGPQAA